MKMLRCTLLVSAALATVCLNGCAGGGNFVTTVVQPVSIPHMQGRVYGGQSPVVGVTVKLYATGNTGYGSAYSYTSGTSLLGSHTVTTDASGSFDITGDYTCPSASTQVYLVGTGGTPIPGQPANPNLAMMVALGPCGALTANTYIAVNELTTVASVWALAPFMTGISNVGSSASNTTGLVNAFAAVNKLVDTRDATLPGPALPAGASIPTAEINTLADIIESCIDSSGGSSGDGSSCGTLFSLAKNANGIAPTDTITAAMNIAQNPAQNVSALNLIPGAKPAFQPTLGNTPPAAWTIAIRYTAGGTLSAPSGIAADQTGKLWIANKSSHTVTLLDTGGNVLSGTAGFAAGQSGQGAIAIDQNGHAWVAANTSGSILAITATGTTTIYTGGGLTTTTAIAVDGQGQVWAAGTGSALSAFTSSGTPLASSSFTGGGLSNAQSIAILH